MKKRTSLDVVPRTMLIHFMEAWNAHDVEGVLGYLTEDVVWQEPWLPEVVTGRGAVAQSLRDSFLAFPDIAWPLEDFKVYTGDDPAHAASSWTVIGTMRGPLALGFAPTGRRLCLQGTCLYQLRDGLISRHTMLCDSGEALHQLGLLPPFGSRVLRARGRMRSLGTSVSRLRGR